MKKLSFKDIFVKFLVWVMVICWGIFAMYYVYVAVMKRYFYPLKEKELVFYYGDYYELDKALIFAVIKTESGFNDKAESKKGAVGLMQITEKTGEYIAEKLKAENYDLREKETNVNFGCFYIKYLVMKFEDVETAMVAYNAGEGKVRMWLNNKEYSEDEKTLKYVPYKESREYIGKIKENFRKYKKLYGKILDKSERK